MRTILLCVNESQQGQRIDSFLASVLDDVSRTQAARLCDGGHVLLGGAQVQKRALVRAGDEVAVTLPDPVPLADGRSAEASVVIGDTEQWMSTGILRIDSPNRQIKNAAQKMHPAPAVLQGYNQYPILRQFGEFDPDTAYAFNNPTTVTDAQALLLRAWETLYPGEDIALLPHRLVAYQGEMKYDYRTDTYSGDPLPESEATLMVYFDQTVGGIPVICGAAESFTRYAGMNNREAYRYHGAIAITQGLKSIGLNEIYKSLQFHLLSPAVLLAEDVPLCSFEEVKETYLDLIRAGRLRSIANLRLGYAVWLNETGSAFTLLPTWVAEGDLYPDAETPDASGKKQYDAVSPRECANRGAD